MNRQEERPKAPPFSLSLGTRQLIKSSPLTIDEHLCLLRPSEDVLELQVMEVHAAIGFLLPVVVELDGRKVGDVDDVGCQRNSSAIGEG